MMPAAGVPLGVEGRRDDEPIAAPDRLIRPIRRHAQRGLRDYHYRMHKIEVEDQAEALLRYPNGAVGYLFCSTCEKAPGQTIEICGDKGKLFLRDGKLSFYQYHPSISEHIMNPKTCGAARCLGGADCLEIAEVAIYRL